MILFRCSCGAAQSVGDQYAGGTAQCATCGQHLSIPQESDPEVILIYRAGDAEEGVAMTQEQVEAALASAALTPTDLISQEGAWYPLEAVLEGEGLEEATAVPPKVTVKEGPKGEAIVVDEVVGELIPVRMTDAAEDVTADEPPAGEEPGASGFLRQKKKEAKAVDGDEAVGEEPTEEEGDDVPAAKKHKKLIRVAQVLVTVLAMVFGFKFGVGPLISTMRNRPTRVMIWNETGQDYQARLGWRRLKANLSNKTLCRFELYVGMREKQTLTLIPTAGGKTLKTKLTLRPGAGVDVVVGWDGAFDVREAQAAPGS